MAATTDGVAEFFDELTEAWRANDGDAIAAHFVEDGSLVNPFGERADGRGALASMYGEYFARMLAGTTTAIRLGTARRVDDDHVLTDADQTVCAADGDVLLELHVVNLLRRDGDGWRIVDSRPYAFAPPPA